MLRSIVAIILMAAFGAAALTSHYIAMVMYWWYALFRPHDWMWWDISAFRIPLLAAVLFLGYSVMSGRLPRFDSGAERLIALFALTTLTSQIITSCQSIYALTYDHVLVLATVVLLTSRLLDSFARTVGLVLFIAAFFGVTAAGVGLETALSGGTLYGARVGGGGITGSNAVALASGMATFMVLAVLPALWRNNEELLLPWMRKPIFRWMLLGVCGYLILGLVAFVYVSDSRGSAIALALGGVVWMLLQRRPFRWVLSAVLVVTLAFALNLVPEAYYERIATVFVEEEERDNSAESRPHFWITGLAMARENPLGVGVGCYMTQYEYYDSTEGQFGRLRSAHSSYFNIAAELGYAALAIWLLLHAMTLFTLLKVWRAGRSLMGQSSDAYRLLPPMAAGLIASQVTFLAGGLFYEFSYNDITWLMFVIAAALGKIVASHAASSNDPKSAGPGDASTTPPTP